MGALAEYTKRKFGVQTRSYFNPETDSCLVAATVLLRNNPDALAWLLINLGATDLYIAWDRDVGSGHGVKVAANGGSASLSADEDGELVGYELFGASLVAPNDVFIVVTEAA